MSNYIVAYRHCYEPDSVVCTACVACRDFPALTSEDLPDGGMCRTCGRDVLIAEPEPRHSRTPAVDAKADEVMDMVRAHYQRAYREQVRTWLNEWADDFDGHRVTDGPAFLRSIANSLPE